MGVIGTQATIASGAYRDAFTAAPALELTMQACPRFVELVESGVTAGPEAVAVAEEYLAPVREAGVDTLVLGCTHYPLLRDVISDYMGAGVTLIDTGEQAALAAAALLGEQDRLNDFTRAGERRYYASDSAEDFAATASLYLGADISGLVERVAIENY